MMAGENWWAAARAAASFSNFAARFSIAASCRFSNLITRFSCLISIFDSAVVAPAPCCEEETLAWAVATSAVAAKAG
jgi:hypothetical protein